MMDTIPVQFLRDEIERHNSRAFELEGEAKGLRAKADALQITLDLCIANSFSTPGENLRSDKAALKAQVIQILIDADSPLSTRAICRHAEQQGRPIDYSELRNLLYSSIGKTFIAKIGRGIWKLK